MIMITNDHNHDIGLTEADIELDIGRLKTITSAMLGQMGMNTAPQGIDEHIHEVNEHACVDMLSKTSNFPQCINLPNSCLMVVFAGVPLWWGRATLCCSFPWWSSST